MTSGVSGSSRERYEVKTPAQIARQAAIIVRERGWTRYALENSEGRVCALGGLRAAAFGAAEVHGVRGRPNWEAYETAKRTLVKVMVEQITGVPANYGLTTMNDNMVGSGEELAGYMEKAAAKLEEEGD
jgi:hypothetical protein